MNNNNIFNSKCQLRLPDTPGGTRTHSASRRQILSLVNMPILLLERISILLRRSRDSNPEVLADASFQD